MYVIAKAVEDDYNNQLSKVAAGLIRRTAYSACPPTPPAEENIKAMTEAIKAGVN